MDRLALLASNRKITSLFDASGPSKGAPRDLNASAIPEMLSWLNRAGYTQQDLARMRHIHVAGTKGKGSVCAFATSILRQYTDVGTYTSPHLISPRERIAINGQPVTQEIFAEAFFDLWDRFSASAVTDGKSEGFCQGVDSKPFYFRFLTILAWHIFLRQGITSVVMECGIGGEYDATNILPPSAVSAAVVTQLGVDHVSMLGDTVDKIAWHKAGIFKQGVNAFTMNIVDQPKVMKVLRDRAEEKGAKLTEVEPDLIAAWGGVEGLLQGDFQKSNQALAVLATRTHLGIAEEPSAALYDMPEAMTVGLKEARVRGRCEVIKQKDVDWLMDGAHTKESLEQVAGWLAHTIAPAESITLIFNQQERNAGDLLRILMETIELRTGRSDVIKTAIFTRNEQLPRTEEEGERDLSVQEFAADTMRELQPQCHVEIHNNIQEAVASARAVEQSTGRKPHVLVTGSMHLVGGVLLDLEPYSMA